MALKLCPSCGQNNPGDSTNCLHCEHVFAAETIEQPKGGFPLVRMAIVASVLSLVVAFIQLQISPPEAKLLDRVCLDAVTQGAKVQDLQSRGYIADPNRAEGADARLTCYVKYDHPVPNRPTAPTAPAAPETGVE
jgi:hypothetical protein